MDWKGPHMIYTLEWSPETKKYMEMDSECWDYLQKMLSSWWPQFLGGGALLDGGAPQCFYHILLPFHWFEGILVVIKYIMGHHFPTAMPTPNICGGAIPWGQLDQQISGPNLLSFLRCTMMQLCFCGRVKGWQVSHDKIQEDYTSVINSIQCRWWLMIPKYVSCFELDLTTDPRQGCTLSTLSFNASRWLASRASPAWHGGGQLLV